MYEPTYRQALGQGWQMVWHNKITWILGLLAVLAGQFGLSNFIGKLFLSAGTPVAYQLLPWWVSLVKVSVPQTGRETLWMGWLTLILVLLGILVLLAVVAAQGALAAAAGQYYKKKSALHLGKAWHIGVKHFWRLLAINVGEQIVLVALLQIVEFLLGVFMQTNSAALFAATVAITAAGFFLALIISVGAIYAVGYVVIEEEPLGQALTKAWRLLHEHLLVSVETSLLLLIFNLAIGLLLILASVVLLTPVALLTVLGGLTGYMSLLTVGWWLWLVALLMVAAIIGGIYNAYLVSVWMFLFMKMHREGVGSRLMRWGKRLLGK